MKYFRIIITAVICLAFLVFAFLIRDDLITDKIKAELLEHSILEYRAGASVYIAESDNNSKVFLGKIGSSNIYGIGALTHDKKTNTFSSGLKLVSDNDSFDLSEFTDVLSISISLNSRYLSVISIDGSMKILNLDTNEVTYSTSENEKVNIRNPFDFNSLTSLPYVFSSGDYFVFSILESEEILWGIPQTMTNKIVSVNPENGETVNLFEDEFSNYVFDIMGRIDKNQLLIHLKPSDLKSLVKPDLALINPSTNTFKKLNSQIENIIGYSKRTKSVYYEVDGDIFCRSISSDTISDDKKKMDLFIDELDDNPIVINSRITSNGYLFLETPLKLENNILIDPKTEIPVLLNKQRIPY